MKRWLIGGMVAAWVCIGQGVSLGADEPRQSVVKIFASQSPPNMLRPWEITPASEVTGSGVVIEGGRILTNAHVVSYAQQIYVQPHESSDKLDATVEFISVECDLATLKLDAADAMEKLKPLPMADKLPTPKTKVNVLGYPTGGDTLSVTEGVISRIECAQYYSYAALLRIQVDAAINPGNSGGPGIVDGNIIGVVFSRFPEGQNIGYIIPVEVIRHFLADCQADGKYDGFPVLDINSATVENPALRDYLKLDKDMTGVVVHRVDNKALAELLKPWDVVTACDGVAIDNLGMVPIAEDIPRVHWSWLSARKPPGSKVKLSVVREGKAMEVEIPTATQVDTVIQRMKTDRPTYFIFGTLVFSPATMELISRGASSWLGAMAIRGRLIPQYIAAYREDPENELVVTCCPMLSHKLTKGYGITPVSVLTHVNDQKVRNLKHLIQLIKDNKEEYIVFRFENENEEKIVLKPKDVAKFQPEILRNNNIPSACSDDLKALWP
ncbi:MAG TPA: trypsin-like peptidase domain-containing protein [Phycisphaerae bacterium]|nr:trypsin-like peptidase domain-containing protein [Phycisphaerae bacterium]HRY68631.1 trypsin-like peptidase domain-containing protein [Phycisphaerae bacterium]HSA25457.1 trypsin-like peptidase domain-containing protein [Phycisphaerae bacterium]